MRASKYFVKYPECYLELPVLNEEGEPVEGETRRIDGYYLGTVRELARRESFITSVDVGLVQADGGLLKVPLEVVHFKR